MKLRELIETLPTFAGVTDDSRQVLEGGIFVAGGGRERSQAYLGDALAKGASVIVGERLELLPTNVRGVIVSNYQVAASELAAAFYRNPSAEILLIGITGTCGKTTTTFLLEAILREAGHLVGVIGTENVRCPAWSLPSPNTTPGPFVLQKIIRSMVDAGCTAVVMEVSSHGIGQERSRHLLFDSAIFTNLSTEHLDFHGSMNNYFAAKTKLFTDYAIRSLPVKRHFSAAINVSDPWGKKLQSVIANRFSARNDYRLVTYSPNSIGADFSGMGWDVNISGITGTVGGVALASKLTGDFNKENIIAAFSCASALGISAEAISAGISSVSSIPGRMERVWESHGIVVIVDFAHKPGALEKILAATRQLQPDGRLILVFGCGGDRDKEKRPLMGAIAAAGADVSVLTSDNVRSEKPDAIIEEVLSGVPLASRERIIVEPDRETAIGVGLTLARKGDIVIIAGRGSEGVLSCFDPRRGEQYQRVFDDRAVARELAARLFRGKDTGEG